MKELTKAIARNVLKQFGLGITRHSTLEALSFNGQASQDIETLVKLNGPNAQQLLKYLCKSKSQVRQDLFVLSYLNFKKHGYFVEFGACNGYDLSNTYLMEKEFGWSGIVADPAIVWHKELKKNRSCNIETNCVWRDSNSTLVFNQVATPELSTINNFSNSDVHSDARKYGKSYSVKTISLNDLLLKYNAPQHIDYLSIDTEGSEYEILRNFDFSKYTFQVITCEHNHTPMREKLYELLIKHGYQRVFEDISRFDDWYVKPTPPQP